MEQGVAMSAPNEIKYKSAPITTAIIIIAHDAATMQAVATAASTTAEPDASGDNFIDSELGADEIAAAGGRLGNFADALH